MMQSDIIWTLPEDCCRIQQLRWMVRFILNNNSGEWVENAESDLNVTIFGKCLIKVNSYTRKNGHYEINADLHDSVFNTSQYIHLLKMNEKVWLEWVGAYGKVTSYSNVYDNTFGGGTGRIISYNGEKFFVRNDFMILFNTDDTEDMLYRAAKKNVTLILPVSTPFTSVSEIDCTKEQSLSRSSNDKGGG